MLRIACVPYMNAYPLWRLLPQQPVFAPPSELVRMMEQGDCDIALLPSIACRLHPEWRIVSETCIASHGAVRSVKLFHRKPILDCRRVALDPESLTSNALLKIILKEHGVAADFGVRPNTADAFLLIGDKALQFNDPTWEALDLGAAWKALTGLPFVYALWLARGPLPDADFSQHCEQSLSQSMRTLDDWLPKAELRSYFTHALQFTLTDHYREGLAEFLRRALG